MVATQGEVKIKKEEKKNNKGYKAQKEGCTTSLLERVCAEWLAGAKRANKIVGC